MPITVFDISDVFLNMEEMTNKKLQKLCYYSQAWHLAFYKKSLVKNKFEAWVHGPVCPELYDKYKVYGWDNIPRVFAVPENIDGDIYEFLEQIFETYGKFSGDQLETLTHSELPWKQAREELEEWEPSHNIISEEIMLSYYRKVYESSKN
jgi:uncharacterized phage-associated protein